MEIKVISDIRECERLWKKFSKNEILWDDWDIITALYNPKLHKPYFMLLLDNTKEIGLLPLMTEKEGGYLFGGTLPESRRIWFEPQQFNLFFEKIPIPLRLFDLVSKDATEITNTHPEYKEFFIKPDYRYYINLEHLDNDFNNHLKARFSGDRRKKFLSDLKKIDKMALSVKWSNTSLTEIFFELNRKRFSEESDYNTDENIKEAKNLVKKFQEKGILHTLEICSGDKTEAITMAAYYNNKFTVIYAASNADIKNLGKRMHVYNVQKAMSLGAKEINFMVGITSWKELWKMDKEEVISFIKLT